MISIFLPWSATAQPPSAQLEALINCPSGIQISKAQAVQLMEDLGLHLTQVGNFIPKTAQERTLFGDRVLTTVVADDPWDGVREGYLTVSVFLETLTDTELAKRIGATPALPGPDGKGPTYVKETGPDTRVEIFSNQVDAYFAPFNASILMGAASAVIACTVRKAP